MKRRDFLIRSAGFVSAAVPLVGRSQSLPCPPAQLSIDNAPAVVTSCSPTNLSQAAAALAPGQSTTSLGDAGLSSSAIHTIQWANRFHVDVAHGRAYLLGKNANSQGRRRSTCVYDIGSNRWSEAIHGGEELGHVYESIALDSSRSELYTGIWAGDELQAWTHGNPLNQWRTPATSGFGTSFTGGTQPAICWHPNLFGRGDGGVIALRDVGSSGAAIVAWRRSNNQWYSVAGGSFSGLSSSYPSNGAIEYVAGGDFCIISLMPSKGGRTFRINAGSGGTLAPLVQISDVPIGCGYTGSGGVGILIDDPAGSPSAYILEKGASNRVWKLNGNNWVLKSYQHPFPGGGPTSEVFWVVASVRTLGVFWARQNRESVPSRLWKPND